MELSLSMIVKNEEDNLARCLSQVADIVDEIVIVDTGSTDRTKEIATQFTGNLFDFVWVDDFSAARNFAFSKVTKDYVLWLDADDIVTPENQKKLRALKRKLDGTLDGVYMPYDHYENGVLINSFPRLRIVRRAAGFRWRDRIHETLEADDMRACAFLHSDIRIAQEIKPRGTTGRYLEILRSIVEEDGARDLRYLFLYASELEKNGADDRAVAQFERYFKAGGLSDPSALFASMQLGSLYEKRGELEKALQLYADCMPVCGDRAEFCCQLGNFYLNAANDIEEALFWYDAALRCARPKGVSVLERYYYYVPHFCLFRIYEMLDEKELASEHFAKASAYMEQLGGQP